MKYIRTEDGIYERMFPDTEHRISFDHKTTEPAYYTTKHDWIAKKDVVKQADNIEELCDRFVIEYKQHNKQRILKTYIKVERNFLRDKMYELNHIKNIYGAIWTDKGLIYVAKMNEKGELELI